MPHAGHTTLHRPRFLKEHPMRLFYVVGAIIVFTILAYLEVG
jgi:hypothetical protein